MKDEVNSSESRGATARETTEASGVSRRTFVKRLSAIGAGTVFLGGIAKQAKAQYGPTHVDGLSADQLAAMYTDMLKIRLWESKVKDLILAGGFRGVAHLYVGEEAIAVGICSAL